MKLNKNILVLICFIIISLFAALAINNISIAANSEIIYENYSVTRIMGTKTGYVYTIQRKKTENKKRYIITDRHFEQKVKRLNNTIQIIQDTSYVEEESGKPVSFSMNSDNSGEKTKITGKFISDNEMLAEFDINGVKSSKNIKFKDKILFPYAIDNLYKYPDNKEITYSTIEPSIDIRTVKIKSKSQGKESLSSDGLRNNYTKYKLSVNILPGITSYEWRDRNGQVVKEAIPFLKMEQVLSNKKEIANITGDYDVFSGSLIYVDKAITEPELLEKIDYKVTLTGDSQINPFLQDERQKTKQLGSSVIYLTVKNVKPESGNFPYPFAAKDFKEYLKSGPFIMPDSDKISAAAKSIVNGETDAYVIAKKMEEWVFDNITNKDYSTDFANAVQTMETKSGDCTEHSVLLASLLRAAGIPSKIVVGMIYTDVPKPAFGYHMWTKAYIGSKWVNLDATLPYKSFVPIHIAMAESSMNNLTDRTDLLINVLKSFSGMKIEILNANKPVISKLNNGILKINFVNSDQNEEFLTIKTFKNNVKSLSLDDAGIKNISLSGFDEKDYVRAAFYNFIKGNIQKSLNDFNSYYNSIPENDDFSYMRLGLKLSSLGFFNLAEKSFENVKDKSIWEKQIETTRKICFPKNKYSPSEEILISDALSKIKFQNLPEEGLVLINKNKFKNNDFTHYLLAKAYQQQNKLALAQEELEKAIRLNSENLTYRMEQAKIYIQRNSYKSAERELNFVKETAEKNGIEDIAFRQDFNEQNYWLKFKAERKNPLKSKFYKAKYYETKKEYNTALELLKSISAEAGNKAEIFETIGNIYLKTNRLQDAEQNFKKALEFDEKSTSALAGMGEIYFSTGKNIEALEKYKKALEIAPDNDNFKLKLAEIYEAMGQEEDSYRYYKGILQNSSANPEANYSIAMMYLRSGDINEAETLLKKAISADPMHSLAWIDIAGIELSKGNYNLAENYLKPIEYMDGKNAYYYYYSGLIYKAKGDFDKAQENFDRAIELNPDFARGNQDLRRL